MKLLIDVGNTRLKWSLCTAGALGEVQAIRHGGDLAAAVHGMPAVGVSEVIIASVCDRDLNLALTIAIRERYTCAPRLVVVEPDCAGLRIAYQEPGRLGVDRWLAMLGAWRQVRGAFCMVSAGTALTFDAVDQNGQHLGGLIAPGVTAMSEAVLGRTRFAAATLPESEMPALGSDTESCVAQGALHAALGMLDRASRDHAGPRLICGGDALRLLPGLGPKWQLEADAVMRGLMLIEADADN